MIIRGALSRSILPCLLLTVGTALLGISTSLAHDLTFEERVAAQEAIERVYYSHQIGATKPFEEAVPRDVLERKVHAYLKQSVALEEFWHTAITGEMLDAELARIAGNSRMPDRLKEMYRALGNDTFLLEECVARPLLADRLIHNFFANDQRFHASERQEAEALHSMLLDGRLSPTMNDPRRTVIEVSEESSSSPGMNRLPHRLQESDGDKPLLHRKLSSEEFSSFGSRLPVREGEVGPVIEERDSFLVNVPLELEGRRIRLVVYSIPKRTWHSWWGSVADSLREQDVHPVAHESLGPPPAPMRDRNEGASSWSPASTDSCPDDFWDNGQLDDFQAPRDDLSAVWTGNEMVVWGGYFDDSSPLNSGSRYNPMSDTWSAMSVQGAPLERFGHSAVWTGQYMLVWGGASSSQESLDDGAKYDPLSDTWSPISSVNAPSPRLYHSTIWTGSEMIIWGGESHPYHLDVLNTGGRYNPASDQWSPIATEGAPAPRFFHTAVWAGDRMIVWGGRADSLYNSGGVYDPGTDTWSPTLTVNAPDPRYGHTAVWTGKVMVVWGGMRFSSPLRLGSGGRYDPLTDTWSPTSLEDAPTPRSDHSAVWTGASMIIWGGDGNYPDNHSFDTGARYDPEADAWSPVSTVNAPSPRFKQSAVWTGSLMLIWGGYVGISDLAGGRYDPKADSWTPISTGSGPTARTFHTAVWTGNVMVIWGGSSPYNQEAVEGGRYDPVMDEWSTTSTVDAPSARIRHRAVWTGSRMMIWGGSYSTALNTGGLYDPIADVWTSTSLQNAPSPRVGFTMVWTGKVAIVWGGVSDYYDPFATYFYSEGLYDPQTDKWKSIYALERAFHTAVWTGSEMVIWGGKSRDYRGRTYLDSSGIRYNPSTDSLTYIKPTGAPSARWEHTAVWTGEEMLIWGGIPESATCPPLNTGGRYNPVTDTWAPISTAGAPWGRTGHVAVWTGKRMLIWGQTCYSPQSFFNEQYDPVTDSWSSFSAIGAPLPRYSTTAVWTGRSMIVWGGSLGDLLFNSGGRYVPDGSLLPPTVDAGPGQVIECSGPSGARVSLMGTANACSDASSLSATWTGPFVEGEGVAHGLTPSVILPLGVNTLLLTVSDGQGGTATDEVTITVQDTTPPALTCPTVAPTECSSMAGTPVAILAAQAVDLCDPNPVISNSHTLGGEEASGEYPLGQTEVTMKATDVSGNQAGCTFPVTVQDTTPPRISSTVSPSILWPPNHRLVDMDPGVVATDACSSPSVVLTSVTSSEPDDAPGGGDGSTTGDIHGAQIGTDNLGFQLRAERDGAGEGRVYQVTYTATDSSGNKSSAEAIVYVPHDLGAGTEPVVLSTESTNTGTLLKWDPVPGATSYKVIRGNVGNLREAGGFFDLGTVSCIQAPSAATGTLGNEDSEIPALGQAFFYLVAYNDGQDSGYGSDTATKPRVKTGGGCE